MRADYAQLIAVLDNPHLGEGNISFTPEAVESLVRAIANLRLRLRARELRDITDEALESGAIDPEALNAEQVRALWAFSILATIQQFLVENM